MPARLLVTGARGQLGRELVARAMRRGLAVVALPHGELDIGDRQATALAIGAQRPDVVVNAAAYTAVDQAESDPDRAFAVNEDGPRNLALACAALGSPLIHVSTDYVFDGSKAGAYLEDDPVAPINVYGASKEAGERALRATLEAHVILRTSWVYGVHGSNFVKTMLRLAAERPTLSVVADQHGCPTAAGDLAEAGLDVAQRLLGGQRSFGTYHFAGRGIASWHELAVAALELGLPEGRPLPPVLPVPATAFPRPARRPANSALDCRRIETVFGIVPRPWREALAEVGRELRSAA